MTLLDLPNPNAGLDAVTLADGRFLLVYNHARSTKGNWAAGRGVLNVALSTDGTAWSAALVLENEPGQEFSYPAAIQTPDRLAHITYTWKRQRIRHVVLDPSKIELRPIVRGEWPKYQGSDPFGAARRPRGRRPRFHPDVELTGKA
jgi:predicted neuraminidase